MANQIKYVESIGEGIQLVFQLNNIKVVDKASKVLLTHTSPREASAPPPEYAMTKLGVLLAGGNQPHEMKITATKAGLPLQSQTGGDFCILEFRWVSNLLDKANQATGIINNIRMDSRPVYDYSTERTTGYVTIISRSESSLDFFTTPQSIRTRLSKDELTDMCLRPMCPGTAMVSLEINSTKILQNLRIPSDLMSIAKQQLQKLEEVVMEVTKQLGGFHTPPVSLVCDLRRIQKM